MLSLNIDANEALRVTQTNEPPTVYSDHWALMSVAKNDCLANRFINALNKRNGTLALSWVNLAEVAKITDEHQIKTVEQFVDAISPQLLFISADPWPVIDSEDEVVQRRRTDSAWGDSDLLKVLIGKETQSANPLTAKGLFSNLRDDEILRKFDDLGDEFISRIENLRKHYAEDSQFAKAVRKPPRGSPKLPATRFLLLELLGSFVKNPMQQITRNDAVDFFHAIVPLSYCDYVLLDGHWATQAKYAAQRLYKVGQVTRIARAFSGRRNGLLKFLEVFESETNEQYQPLAADLASRGG